VIKEITIDNKRIYSPIVFFLDHPVFGNYLFVKRFSQKIALSANVEYTPYDGDVTCSGCSASYR